MIEDIPPVNYNVLKDVEHEKEEYAKNDFDEGQHYNLINDPIWVRKAILKAFQIDHEDGKDYGNVLLQTVMNAIKDRSMYEFSIKLHLLHLLDEGEKEKD